MLEKIKQLVDIELEDNTPFPEFYVKYMLDVQDYNIDLEVTSAFRAMNIEVSTLKKVDKLIDSQHRKMVK